MTRATQKADVEQNGQGDAPAEDVPQRILVDATIHERMVAVLAELPPIGKDRRNEQQKFHFRGHDDVMNALNPLLAKHGVFVVPTVLERVVGQRETRSGGIMFEVNLHVSYRFYGMGGDFIEASTWGEGTDSGDKATNKAMTMAFKNVLAQSFAISTEEFGDADAGTPEESVASGSRQRPSDVRRDQAGRAIKPPTGWAGIKTLVSGMNPLAWEAYADLLGQARQLLDIPEDREQMTQEQKDLLFQKGLTVAVNFAEKVPHGGDPPCTWEDMTGLLVDEWSRLLDGVVLIAPQNPAAETPEVVDDLDAPFGRPSEEEYRAARKLLDDMSEPRGEAAKAAYDQAREAAEKVVADYEASS